MRDYLEGNILLCEENDKGIFKREFTVIDVISEGGSSVCYEAYHGNSSRGTLKEFYPEESYALERVGSQLVNPAEFGDSRERFSAAAEEYMETYGMIAEARRNNPELATFIPSFEVYRGCDEEGNKIGSIYIWTPEPALETFDKICDDIHNHPEVKPEHKLVTVLTAIEQLTKCTRLLHSAGLIHRDIKPSNFGFVRRGDETLTQTISLFDINTMCSAYSDIKEQAGTEGFIEPESGLAYATNQTDIYSIGATLYYALIVNKEARRTGFCYKNEDHDRIRELVNSSELIRASEANSHPGLRDTLTHILQKCLCSRTERYRNCQELINDLDNALYYALPTDIAGKRRSSERWMLADIEKSLDINKEKNSFLTIQYSLYEHPLYKCLAEDEDTINILIIGFGNYGQKFLDASLQNGQIRNKKLNVTVISDDTADKIRYLEDRPQLSVFFNIDGSVRDDDHYGNVHFVNRELGRDDVKGNALKIEDAMYEHCQKGRGPHYIFIALGDDQLNRVSAEVCSDIFIYKEVGSDEDPERSGQNTDCIISYISEGGNDLESSSLGLYPIFVNEDIRTFELYPEIERMAFNTHLVWGKDLLGDFDRKKETFNDPYNHDSCVSCVLSVKYKLWSVGIDLDKTTFQMAAHMFAERFGDGRKPEITNELIWIEHRRWVTEKLCQGWSRLDDLTACAGGDTKDLRNKKHICIVRSRPDKVLLPESAFWDDAGSRELDGLDDLDRLYVDLHRFFVRRANEIKENDLLYGSSIGSIRSMTDDDKRASIAFHEWNACMRDIWNGEHGRSDDCRKLEEIFIKSCDYMTEERKKVLRDHVRAFDSLFYPVLASMDYHSWKDEDAALVRNIPFILTYNEDVTLAVPFKTGSNDEIFGNVAAATIINPRKIIYIYHNSKRSEPEHYERALSYIVNYMDSKRLRAEIVFISILDPDMPNQPSDGKKKSPLKIGKGRVTDYRQLVDMGNFRYLPSLEKILEDHCKERSCVILEKNSANLSSLLEGKGFYNKYPNYTFDRAGMTFCNTKDCELVRVINNDPYLTIQDVASFCKATGKKGKQPEFYGDYKELWDKYSRFKGVWKHLCNALDQYCKEHDILLTVCKGKERPAKSYRYILPFSCSRGAAIIVSELKEKGYLCNKSRVYGYTSDSCEVTIVDQYENKAGFDRLFSNAYRLMQHDSVTVRSFDELGKAEVLFDDLSVERVEIDPEWIENVKILMKYFSNKGYVNNLSYNKNRMSFNFGTRQIKELLTMSGKILEVYVYHKVKGSGRFDDVANSIEMIWGDTDNVQNEFDLILTKGLKTVFVECKARNLLKQDFYYKLDSLTKHFGINSRAVLIADTADNTVNDMQEQRGNMLDIVTVTDSAEIKDIDVILEKIVNGEYNR